jgi:hypothetical protein
VTDQEQEQETPEATVEPVEASEPKPKAPRKTSPKPKTVPDPRGKCDSHPTVDAVAYTSRNGAIRTQRFCAKCVRRLPDGYLGG